MRRAISNLAPRRRSARLLTATCLTGCWVAFQAGVGGAQAATPIDQQSAVTEVVVTASRRSEVVTKLPFNISAYGGQQLARANITNVAALSQEVPNFVIQDQGARSTASSIPIIRGLNASQPVVSSPRFFQSPVGFYLGNAPITGSLPIEDVQRIEVLRGPQGTLYGGGTLAGAVRIVPNDPKLESFSGELSASASNVAHSSHVDSDLYGMVNIPVGSDIAIRLVAKGPAIVG